MYKFPDPEMAGLLVTAKVPDFKRFPAAGLIVKVIVSPAIDGDVAIEILLPVPLVKVPIVTV